MSHFTPCITTALRDFPDCRNSDGTLRAATRGEVCETCYQRIDAAIGRADHLRTALAGIDRAITAESSNTIAGPRLPLTAIRLDLNEIASYQQGATDPTSWVSTQTGAEAAVRFARAVHRADRAHPTVAGDQKLHRTRCPACRRLTAVVRPPDWYGDATAITCIACGWEAENPDALDIVAEIETRGRLDDADLIMLELRARRRAERAEREAKRGVA
jgi:RNase P subunit RPR2